MTVEDGALTSRAAHRIPSLDGLRAISITMVVIGHLIKSLGHEADLFKTGALQGLAQGNLGVTIFFGISGYLITGLLLREMDATGRISIKNFYIRRAFRIWPAYYCYVGLICILGLVGVVSGSLFSFASALFFFWNYNFSLDPGTVSWFLAHCWSLCVEEQFYMLWPLALLTLGEGKARRLAIILICISPFVRVLTYFLITDNAVRGQIGSMLQTRADALMFGALAAMLVRLPDFEQRTKLFRSKLVPLLCACFLFGIRPFLSSLRGSWALTVGFTLDSLCSVLLMMWFVEFPGTLVGRFLNSKLLVHLGVISYSLYLWQQLFLTNLNTTISGRFPLNIVCALLAAELSYWLIERFFLKLRKKIAPEAA